MSFHIIFFTPIGVLWHIHDIILGVKECLTALKKHGKKLKFVTNNSVRPEADYQEMFKQINIELNDSDLIHPIKAIISHLKEINFEGSIYCIACTNVKTILKDAGFEIVDDPMDLVPESFTKVVKLIRAPEPVKAVIVDVDFNISHPKVARAAFFLNKPDVLFMTGATDLKLPLGKNLTILGPGYFTNIIEEHTQRESLRFAKPSKFLAENVVKKCGSRGLFIGDM